MRRTPTYWLCCTVPLLLTGCHLVFGPPEGHPDWWYFCDETGCYECNASGCEMPGSTCGINEHCPPSMYCDAGVCETETECDVTAECGPGYVCIAGSCTPARTPCGSHEMCGAGAYCSNGICKNTGTCLLDKDCEKWGSNFVCDSRGTCVPGEAPVASCQSGSACPDGLCVDGTCGSCAGDCGGGKTCQFNKHCGAGRACFDGQCTSTCAKPEECADGQTCQGAVCVPDTWSFCLKSADCGAGQVCVNNACYQECTVSGLCLSSLSACSTPISLQSTDVKACFPDHSAKLECKVNKDCTGESCVNGICRTSCQKPEDCAGCSDGPVCGPGGFCMTASEASPQCSGNAQCRDGKVCLDAQCVLL